MQNLNDEFIIFQGICIILTVILIYILLIRSYFLYRKLDIIIKNLPILNFILSILIILFFTQSFLEETYVINTFDGIVFFTPHTITSTSVYASTLILLFYFDESVKYLFRIFAIILLLFSILGTIYTFKKKKILLNLIPLLSGILSHFLIMLDFDQSSSNIIYSELSFISIFWLILLIISTFILLKNKKKTA